MTDYTNIVDIFSHMSLFSKILFFTAVVSLKQNLQGMKIDHLMKINNSMAITFPESHHFTG